MNNDLISRLTLDPASAENNAGKSQDQWIAYWNKSTDGRRFASMADYYQVFKQLNYLKPKVLQAKA